MINKTLSKPHRACCVAILLLIALSAGTVAAQERFLPLQSLFNPSTNAQADAQQGHSVAVDGDIAVVGAPYDAVGGDSSGVVKVYHASTGSLWYTLTNPSPAGRYKFGWSVAIAGTRIVVGSPDDSTAAFEAGSAHVYDLAGSNPTRPILTLVSPQPSKEGNFGFAVAISGSRLVVGARWEEIDLVPSGAAYVFDLARATPAAPVLTVTNPNPADWTLFGSTVAISGDHVAVGAPQDRFIGAGRVFVYDLAHSSSAEPIILNNPDSDAHHFGFALSISGTRVVVGAQLNDDALETENVGVAYVFDLADPVPTVPTLTLPNPNPTEESFFGNAVAITGNRVVVGAYRHFAGATFSVGIAYVYDLLGPVPVLPTVTLTNPSSGDNEFGFSVAVNGDRVLVGAHFDSTQARHSGGAYLYDLGRPNSSAPVARLDRASPSSGGGFGAAVAVSRTRAIVGARNEGTSGAAFIYNLDKSAPGSSAMELLNPHPTAGGKFGTCVALSGTKAVVGEPTSDLGRAFVYDLSGETPAVAVMTLQNPDPDWTWFGSAAAISGNRVAVSAIWNRWRPVVAGGVFVYDLGSAAPELPVNVLNNPSPMWQDDFGAAVVISGSRVVVGAPKYDPDWLDSGIAYVYDLASDTPNVAWLTLTNPTPGMFNYFGGAVAIFETRVLVAAANPGRVYVYDLASLTPTVPVTLLSEPNPAAPSSFGSSVGLSGNRAVVGAQWYDAGAGKVGAGRAYVFDLSSSVPTVPIAALSNPTPSLYDFFGSAVAVEGQTIMVGASGDDNGARDRGAAYLFGLPPTLRLTPAGPGLATLSWTPSTTGVVLQYADSLTITPSRWLDAPSGSANPVTVPLTEAARFYRLFAP